MLLNHFSHISYVTGTFNDYETIKYAVNDGVAKIEFNRPDAGNSINRKFAHEFMDVA